MARPNNPQIRSKTPPTRAEIEAIRSRFVRGDQTVAPDEARSLLDAIPSLVQILASPARRLAEVLLENYTANAVIREATRRQLEEVRSGLAGPNPSPLEGLLAERAAICWLAVNSYERSLAQMSKMAHRDMDTHQGRIDAAHRRFLSAVKTLATVRKLGLPDIRINVARNQVNVG